VRKEPMLEVCWYKYKGHGCLDILCSIVGYAQFAQISSIGNVRSTVRLRPLIHAEHSGLYRSVTDESGGLNIIVVWLAR